MDKLSTITLPDNRTYAFQAETAIDLCGELKADQKFAFRRAGDGALTKPYSAAAIRRLLGNTVVFNQLWGTPNTQTKQGVTISYDNEDKCYVLNGTAAAADSFYLLTGFIVGSLPVGHLGLIAVEVLGGSYTAGTASNGYVYAVYVGNSAATTQALNAVGRKEAIQTATGSSNAYPIIKFYAGDVFTNLKVRVSCIDLTQMFGSGYEPSTVAEFKAIYPLADYSPNAGKALPFACHALETTGLNQWDEVWELGGYNNTTGAKDSSTDRIRSKNAIPVFPNTTYYFRCSGGTLFVYWYDADGSFISYTSCSNSTLTSPANAHSMRFRMSSDYGTTYKNDICINLSDTDRNGTYEPFQRNVATLGLDSFRVKDAQGNIVTVNGLWSVAACDEVDNWRKKYVKRVAKVNLKLLDWHRGGDNVYYAPDVRVGGDGRDTNIISEGPWTPSESAWSQTYVGQIMTFNGSYLWIHDNRFSGLEEFVAAMEDVSLIYELVTPVEYDLVDDVTDVYHMHPLGTEGISPENGPEPYTAPARMDIQYGVSAGDLASAVSDVERKTKKILASREYDYACAASSQAAGYIFFGNVVPTSDDAGNAWYIRYRVYVDLNSDNPSFSPNNKYCHGVYECRVGVAGTTLLYEVFNQMFSASYRPIYSHLVTSYSNSTEGGSTVTWQSKYANRATNPVKIGLRIQSAYADTQPRHYRIELLEVCNCSFAFLNAFETYGAVYSSAKYGTCSALSGDNGLQESGDANDISTLQLTYSQITAGAGGIKMYSIIMQDASGNWQSLTTTSGTGVSKTVNPAGFRLGSKLYYVYRNTDVAANSRLGTSQLRANYANVDFRYSLNINTTAGHIGNLVPFKPLYIVGTIDPETGLFYLDTTLWWAQDEPLTEDGKIYIKVCEAIYNDYGDDRCYRGDFFSDGQMFWFKDGSFKRYDLTEAPTATLAEIDALFDEGGGGGSGEES